MPIPTDPQDHPDWNEIIRKKNQQEASWPIAIAFCVLVICLTTIVLAVIL